MNDHIPFFSDLPFKAIPAVQRLFDEAQDPGYSLPQVYSNLVSRLNASGVTPPPRAIVKRWIAGVKVGLIARPVAPFGIDDTADASSPEPDYFGSLPETAAPALAEVWDAVQAATGLDDEEDADERAFDAFFEAMRAIGHKEPQWRGFVAYARAIRLGHVERPARQIVEELDEASPDDTLSGSETTVLVEAADMMVVDPETAEAVRPIITTELIAATGKCVRTAVDVPQNAASEADTEGFVPLTPSTFVNPYKPQPKGRDERSARATAEEATAQLYAIRDRMIAETYARLQADMRRQAELLVITQLRAVADEMERGIA